MFQYPTLVRRGLLALLAVVAVVWIGSTAYPQANSTPSADQQPLDKDHAAKMAKGLELFKKQVRPVLAERCVRCHGGDKTQAEFDLTDRKELLRGGKSGPAILEGKGKDSLLYKLVTHQREPMMPKNGKKLSDEQIAAIAQWIDLGAPYDEPLVAKKTSGPHWSQKTVSAKDSQFWSFQPLKKVTPPKVKNSSWCQTPIDFFIADRLDQEGLHPNPPATKIKLIRRAYLDLIGLPPTPAQVAAFLKDDAPDAYARLIDDLLSSPHYGERQATPWLDLARFAESHGFEHDTDRPTAYHYRDFVIKAFNLDLPYDTFVKWQIAGDELEPDNALANMATGFLAAGVHSTQITKNEVEKHRYDELDDKLNTLGTAMLGLSIGCARCHDHKYDPIPQADYYKMLATFTTTVRTEPMLDLDPTWYKKAKATFDKEHEPLVKELKQFEAQKPAPQLAVSPWEELHVKISQHLAKAPRPKLVKALIASEGLPAVRLHTQGDDFFPKTFFLKRGDPNQKEGEATQSFLQVLMRAPDKAKHWQIAPPAGWRTSFRRASLASWITDVDQGAGHLLARVIVNRLWQAHFGKGLVATPSDFGTRGEKPSHPELLDWLAGELIRNGWRLKPIHKLIMTSAVYEQSAAHDDERAKVDPANKLLWHFNRRRLEAEAFRDSMLSISGMLDATMFGPGTLDEGMKRRSIYFTVKRSKLIPMLQIFDAPQALTPIDKRPSTTVAPQALLLMNNPHVRGWAKALAQHICPDEKTPLAEAIRKGYQTALSREPMPQELAQVSAFVQMQIQSYQGPEAREKGLTDFCQVLMCLNEFIYVD